MKNFIVHVVDEVSQHMKKTDDSEPYIIEGQSDSGKRCEIARYDSFYLVEVEDDESESEAITSVADKARIRDTNGNFRILSDALTDTVKEIENSDIDSDKIIPRPIRFSYADETSSFLVPVSCQINKVDDNAEWIELHQVYFYVIKDTQIISLRNGKS